RIDVLVGAAAAHPEMRTARAHPAAALAIDRDHVGDIEAGLAADHGGAHRLARQPAPHEYHLAVVMGDAVALQVERLDLDGDQGRIGMAAQGGSGYSGHAARYSTQCAPGSLASVSRKRPTSPWYSSTPSWPLMSMK